MNILMFTNTFTPHVGGVAKSVEGFVREFRGRNHRVMVVAPLFKDTPAEERDVIRVPAVMNFNGSDFSIPLPVPGRLASIVRAFEPHVVHSHHPCLLGDTALRVAAALNLPVVFTYHTMYEKYTHYMPVDSRRFRQFVVRMVTGYCNMCDAVIAPGRTVVELLRRRGVKTPVDEIPTGVDLRLFAAGDGSVIRERMGLKRDDFVVGHVGRLVSEKNLGFLTGAVARFLAMKKNAHFLVAGDGPYREEIERIMRERGLLHRLHLAGILVKRDLVNAYAAMDVFAFASQTETQGMVLAEALAAGTPVVAVDASGAREVVKDGVNGRLLQREDADEFAAALSWAASLEPVAKGRLREAMNSVARKYSMTRSAGRILDLYEALILKRRKRWPGMGSGPSVVRLIGKQWKIMGNIAQAAGGSVIANQPGGRSGRNRRPVRWI